MAAFSAGPSNQRQGVILEIDFLLLSSARGLSRLGVSGTRCLVSVASCRARLPRLLLG